VRDHGNEFDPNAIAVLADGMHAGYMARESARILRPLLDDQDGPTITAVLADRPDKSTSGAADITRFEEHDKVLIRVTVAPPEHGTW
jgi:HIRAN domain